MRGFRHDFQLGPTYRGKFLIVKFLIKNIFSFSCCFFKWWVGYLRYTYEVGTERSFGEFQLRNSDEGYSLMNQPQPETQRNGTVPTYG